MRPNASFLLSAALICGFEGPLLGATFEYQHAPNAPDSWNDARNWKQDGMPAPAQRLPGTDSADEVVINGVPPITGQGDWIMKKLFLAHGGGITGGSFTF